MAKIKSELLGKIKEGFNILKPVGGEEIIYKIGGVLMTGIGLKIVDIFIAHPELSDKILSTGDNVGRLIGNGGLTLFCAGTILLGMGISEAISRNRGEKKYKEENKEEIKRDEEWKKRKKKEDKENKEWEKKWGKTGN